MTIGEVAVQKKLTAHGISVLYAIKSLVDNLEDLDTLTHLIRKNARNHAERGISGADYKVCNLKDNNKIIAMTNGIVCKINAKINAMVLNCNRNCDGNVGYPGLIAR